LGIAHRHIQAIYTGRSRKQTARNCLSEKIQSLGDWIQAKRIEQNLTHWHLAQKMGIASGLVKAWERGSRVPDANQMQCLAAALGVDVTDLGNMADGI
jgi:ribosome-binding protein aMBF1 (putative translation factor)